jgi:hypothetical protein
VHVAIDKSGFVNYVFYRLDAGEKSGVWPHAGGSSNIRGQLQRLGLQLVRKEVSPKDDTPIPQAKLVGQSAREAVHLLAIVRNAFPFRTTEEPCMKSLANSGLNRHNTPQKLKGYAKLVKNEVKETLQKVPALSGAIDEWKGYNGVDFGSFQVAGVTREGKAFSASLGHIRMKGLTSAMIAETYKYVMFKFDIWEKVKYIVCDNTNSVKKAVETDLGKKRSPCYAHVYNLMLGDLLRAFEPELKPLYIIAGRSRQTSTFREICDRHGTRAKSLTTYTRTRFYSSMNLFHNAAELKPQVLEYRGVLARKREDKMAAGLTAKVLATLEPESLEDYLYMQPAPGQRLHMKFPTEADLMKAFEAVDEIKKPMARFASEIGQIEGDNFLTLGRVLEARWLINHEINQAQSEQLQAAWEQAQRHWSDLIRPEDEVLLKQALLLTPDGCHSAVLGDVDYAAQVEALKAEVDRRLAARPVVVGQASAGGGKVHLLVPREQVLCSVSGIAKQHEWDRYKAHIAHLQPGSITNPLKWWFERRDVFPGLWELVAEIGIIPASGCATERQFSKAKRQLIKARVSIGEDTLDAVIVLQENIEIACRVMGLGAVTAADLQINSRIDA